MKTAIIIIDEAKEEAVEVKQYGDKTALYIDAHSAEDAARLLIENKDRPADPEKEEPVAELIISTEEEPRYKMLDLREIRRETQRFEQSKEGKALAQRLKEAEDANGEGANLFVSDIIYLETLVLQGRVFEAFYTAYVLGTHRSNT